MPNCSQNCWINWMPWRILNDLFHTGVWTFARFVRPLLAITLCIWEIWSPRAHVSRISLLENKKDYKTKLRVTAGFWSRPMTGSDEEAYTFCIISVRRRSSVVNKKIVNLWRLVHFVLYLCKLQIISLFLKWRLIQSGVLQQISWTIRAYWSKRRVVPPVLFRTNYYSIEILHGVTAIILTYHPHHAKLQVLPK